jgi:hypothetical protein
VGTINHYERIRLALEELRSALEPFVEERLKEAHGDGWRSRYAVPEWSGDDFNTDVQVLANTIVNNWDDVFSRQLRREAKHLVHQVRKTRNRFAHQEGFDQSDTYSALHEAQRLLEAIGADPAKIVASKRELVAEMARAGESPEDVERKAEEAADAALAEGASDGAVHARLVMLRKGQPSEIEFLVVPPMVIGRADASVGAIDVDLTAFEEGAYVSRRHAKIAVEGGAFVLEDLGSSNGTYIKRDDYEKVERVELEDGDEVAFGNAKFVFRIER